MEHKYKDKSLIAKYWHEHLKEDERKAIKYAYKYEGYCAIEGLPLGYTEFALKMLYNPN